jgi:hypothetical protein
MVFPFMSQLLGQIPGWVLFPLWYIAAASVLIAALWRKMQPPRQTAPAYARVNQRTRTPEPYLEDSGLTWLVRR